MFIGHWQKRKMVSWEKLENQKMSNLQSRKKVEFDIYKAENSGLYCKTMPCAIERTA